MSNNQVQPTSVLSELMTSGLSVGVATAVTNPLDVVKVRQQMRGLTLKSGEAAPGVFSTFVEIARKEGPIVLSSGMGASVARGLVHGGLRLGLYSPIKSTLGAEGADVSLFKKIAAGGAAGSIAASIASPMDLIKTRLQSKQARDKDIISVVRKIVYEEGARGLWHGVTLSMTRSAVLTAAQCATYDEVKQWLIRITPLQDNFYTHLTSSMITGLVSTTMTTPIDVAKTQIMVRGGSFRVQYLYNEGPLGLFKGWGASYLRLGPQTTIIFLTLEVLRSYFGMGSL